MKNDIRDAADLADLLRMGRLPEAYIASPQERELRELARHRAKLEHVQRQPPLLPCRRSWASSRAFVGGQSRLDAGINVGWVIQLRRPDSLIPQTLCDPRIGRSRSRASSTARGPELRW